MFSDTLIPYVNGAPSMPTRRSASSQTSSYAFTAADFGFNDADGDNFQAVKITTLSGAIAGALKDNGVTVTAGQTIALADITGHKLVYTPASSFTGSANFTFQVQDDGGTAAGGVDTDPTPNTMTVRIDATPQFDHVASQFVYSSGVWLLSPNLTLTDADDANLQYGYVSIAGYVTGDVLAATTTGTNITIDFSTDFGTLYLNGVDTVAHYQQVMQSVTYQFTGADPTAGGSSSNRFVYWTANDGTAYSPSPHTTITFGAGGPSLASVAVNVSFAQGGSAIQLSPSLTVSDPAKTTLSSATVVVTGGKFTGDGDALAAVTTGTSITASYSSTTDA